ncbi:hypothetical protein CAPTEDRAFT_216408, partial [Capitella teleta]
MKQVSSNYYPLAYIDFSATLIQCLNPTAACLFWDTLLDYNVLFNHMGLTVNEDLLLESVDCVLSHPENKFHSRDRDKLVAMDQLMQRQLDFRKRELLYHCTTPKKLRGTYEKGQHQMILDDIIPESEVPDREKAWIDP